MLAHNFHFGWLAGWLAEILFNLLGTALNNWANLLLPGGGGTCTGGSIIPLGGAMYPGCPGLKGNPGQP
jgi:hypothetical protein